MTLAGTHKPVKKAIKVNIVYIHNRVLLGMHIQLTFIQSEEGMNDVFARKWMLKIVIV